MKLPNGRSIGAEEKVPGSSPAACQHLEVQKK